MGYFDGLTDAVFKKDAAGKTLFYPWGAIGSGFIIESNEEREKVRAFYKKMYVIVLLAIIIIQSTLGAWLNFALFPVYGVWYYFTARNLTKNMMRTGERLTLAESRQSSANSHNLPTLIFLDIISLGFVAIGVFLIAKGENGLVPYACAGFFGLCSFNITRMLIAKIKSR